MGASLSEFRMGPTRYMDNPPTPGVIPADRDAAPSRRTQFKRASACRGSGEFAGLRSHTPIPSRVLDRGLKPHSESSGDWDGTHLPWIQAGRQMALLQIDRSITEALNRAAQHAPLRALALAMASYLLVVAALLLVGLAIAALRHRDPQPLALLALAALGAATAVGLNLLVGHLYFRLRPYWALPTVHPIGARRGDSSFFSAHAAAAAGLAVGLLRASRRWGLAAVGLALLVGLGRVAIGANYPFDVLVGFLVGAACVAALLLARHPVQRLLDRLLTHTAATVITPARGYERRVGVAALVLLAALGGWMVARLQDHGLRIALNRADARLDHHLPTDARLYRQASIDQVAAGRWRPTRARVYGQVTYVNRELDGDVHVVLKAPDGSFVVLEIIPELPIDAPHDDDRITAWGIVRHDGLHNWWELHPLVGWTYGQLTAASTGGLDN
jgi:membrane-associated phospholipid phosphatase